MGCPRSLKINTKLKRRQRDMEREIKIEEKIIHNSTNKKMMGAHMKGKAV
jgi:hypothetical protein